jgi:LysM repeat protein
MDNNPVPPAAVAQEHTVAAGESFTTIGKKYGVTADAIAKANPGVDSRKLKINQKLKVPERAAAVAGTTTTTTTTSADAVPAAAASMVTYQVKQGDTLIKIAKNHRTTVEKLKAANNLKSTSIRIDQKLKVPVKAEATTPVATPPPTSTGYVTPLPGRTTASL